MSLRALKKSLDCLIYNVHVLYRNVKGNKSYHEILYLADVDKLVHHLTSKFQEIAGVLIVPVDAPGIMVRTYAYAYIFFLYRDESADLHEQPTMWWCHL